MAKPSFTLVMPAGQSLDAIEWRRVPGHEEYEISEYGHLRRGGELRAPSWSVKTAKWSGTKAYPYYGGLGSAHVMVALAFIGPRPYKFDCAHWDGNPANCHRSNLRWATRRENQMDAQRHGTAAVGEKHYKARLTEAEVRIIRRKRRNGYTYRDLMREFQMSQTAIADIVKEKTWRYAGAY